MGWVTGTQGHDVSGTQEHDVTGTQGHDGTAAKTNLHPEAFVRVKNLPRVCVCTYVSC